MSERVKRELVCDACGYVGGETVDMLQLSVVSQSNGYLGHYDGTQRHACSTVCVVRLLTRYGAASKRPVPDQPRSEAAPDV